MARHGIRRVYDLTADRGHQDLVDWSRVKEAASKGVLHCDGATGTGPDALMPIARLLRDQLLNATEAELLEIQEHSEWVERYELRFKEDIGERAEEEDEERTIIAAREEAALSHARHPQPVKRDQGDRYSWSLAVCSGFVKDVGQLDTTVAGRLWGALEGLAMDPMTARGNTIKPLSGSHKLEGLWRYRVGHYRLVYEPQPEARRVLLVGCRPRSRIYGD